MRPPRCPLIAKLYLLGLRSIPSRTGFKKLHLKRTLWRMFDSQRTSNRIAIISRECFLGSTDETGSYCQKLSQSNGSIQWFYFITYCYLGIITFHIADNTTYTRIPSKFTLLIISLLAPFFAEPFSVDCLCARGSIGKAFVSLLWSELGVSPLCRSSSRDVRPAKFLV